MGFKDEAQSSFLYRLRGVWKPDETICRMFDIAY